MACLHSPIHTAKAVLSTAYSGVKVHCEMPLVTTGFKNKGIRCGEGKLKGASPTHLNPNSSMGNFFFITFQMIN